MAVLLRTIALTISLITFSFTIVSAADTIKCTECGMMVDVNSKFASKIVQADGTLYFCDIGDLFSYLKRTKQNSVKAEVKDYKTGEWIDARAAYYVHAEKIFSTQWDGESLHLKTRRMPRDSELPWISTL